MMHAGEWKFQGNGSAFTCSEAVSAGVATVLACNGADDEESEAGALNVGSIVPGDAIKTVEDALEVGWQNANPFIADADSQAICSEQLKAHSDFNVAGGGVFHRIIEDVEKRAAQVFCIAFDDERCAIGIVDDVYRFFGKVVATTSFFYAGLRKGAHVQRQANGRCFALAGFSCAKNLLYGSEEPVIVLQHHAIELLSLLFIDRALHERFEIEANGSDGSFEFVREGVEKAVLPLGAADLADEKDSVDDHAGDHQDEKDDADDEKCWVAACVDDDPADIQCDGRRDQADAQHQEEANRTASARNLHAPVIIRHGAC